MEPDAPATAGMLREFVLTLDLKLEQIRTEIATEFGRVHARLERLDTRLADLDRRVDQMDRRLDRLHEPPIMGSLVTTMLLSIITLAVLYGVLRSLF